MDKHPGFDAFLAEHGFDLLGMRPYDQIKIAFLAGRKWEAIQEIEQLKQTPIQAE